jgi:hypothetical protein
MTDRPAPKQTHQKIRTSLLSGAAGLIYEISPLHLENEQMLFDAGQAHKWMLRAEMIAMHVKLN